MTYPCDAEDQPGREILFTTGFPTSDGRGKFVPADVLPPDELPDAEYPLILTTGRLLEHWHTGSMTRRALVLDAIEPTPTAQFSPEDLRRLGVAPGEMVRVSTRRGAIELAARSDRDVPPGLVFIPFCFVEAAVNLLTNSALDPFGKIPEFKFCARAPNVSAFRCRGRFETSRITRRKSLQKTPGLYRRAFPFLQRIFRIEIRDRHNPRDLHPKSTKPPVFPMKPRIGAVFAFLYRVGRPTRPAGESSGTGFLGSIPDRKTRSLIDTTLAPSGHGRGRPSIAVRATLTRRFRATAETAQGSP